MNLSSGVSLGQLILAFGSMLVVSGVAWGSLMQRVKTLEREVLALSNFGERLATIEANTQHATSQLDKIVNSWLFAAPPVHDAIRRQPV